MAVSPASRDEIDAGQLMIRRACPADYEPLQAMHRTCSPGSRLHRWFAPLASIPRAYLLDAVSGRPEHLAFVAATTGGAPELVALASAVCTTDREWELGILVADRFQHRGLGRRLLGSLAAELAAKPQQYLAADGLCDHRELLLRSLASVTEIMRVDESLGVVRVIGAVRARQPQLRDHSVPPAGFGQVLRRPMRLVRRLTVE
jgi:GNAT superfamily N-acetyltransferase